MTGRASHARQVHSYKVALERTFVFDTSAHLPFPPAVIRRCLLAAIDMTVRSPRTKSGGLAVPVGPGGG